MAVPDSIAITNSLKLSSDTYYIGLVILAVITYIIWKILQNGWIRKLKGLLRLDFILQVWGIKGLNYSFTEFKINRNPDVKRLLLKAMLTPRKVDAIIADVLIDLGKSNVITGLNEPAKHLPKSTIYEWGEQHIGYTDYKTLFKIWNFCASYEANSPCEPKALTLLGQSYFRGLGVKRDFDKAVGLLKKASDLGDDAASLMLATLSGAGLYGTPNDCDKYLSLITTKESEVVDVVINIRSSTNRVNTCREILG